MYCLDTVGKGKATTSILTRPQLCMQFRKQKIAYQRLNKYLRLSLTLDDFNNNAGGPLDIRYTLQPDLCFKCTLTTLITAHCNWGFVCWHHLDFPAFAVSDNKMHIANIQVLSEYITGDWLRELQTKRRLPARSATDSGVQARQMKFWATVQRFFEGPYFTTNDEPFD